MSAHIDDESLVALLDGALAEERAAAVRTHFAHCEACRARHARMTALVADMSTMRSAADDARANTIATRALDDLARAPRATPRTLLALGASAAVMASLVVVVITADDSAPEAFTPRGDTAATDSELTVYAVREGERARLDERTPLDAGPLSLLVDVTLLPKTGARAFAVYARDARGRVWWLLPSWTDEGARPTCALVSALPLAFSSVEGVVLDVPPGMLEVALVVSDTPCALPALDDALERNLPLGDALRVTARRVFSIAP